VNASDEHLKTPLHWAAQHDHYQIAEMLLDAGGDLEATTSWGATPFVRAESATNSSFDPPGMAAEGCHDEIRDLIHHSVTRS